MLDTEFNIARSYALYEIEKILLEKPGKYNGNTSKECAHEALPGKFSC